MMIMSHCGISVVINVRLYDSHDALKTGACKKSCPELYIINPYMRSSDQQLLTVLRSRLKLKGDHAFSVAAPTMWNVFPVSIRSAPTISSFKSVLKTYLLTQAFNLSGWWVLCSLCLFFVVRCYCLCIFMKMFFFIVVQHIGQQWLLICAIEIKWIIIHVQWLRAALHAGQKCWLAWKWVLKQSHDCTDW